MKHKIIWSALCFLALTMTGCSSDDEPTSDVQTIEFKTSAKDLNNHLRSGNRYNSVGMSYPLFGITAKEEPEVELLARSYTDIYEIPAKGGIYDFLLYKNLSIRLKRVEIYENMPFFSHDENEYLYPQGEFYSYLYLTRGRENPDAVANFSQLLDSDNKRLGSLSGCDPTKWIKMFKNFTYNFPQNTTGKYRLINFVYEYNHYEATDIAPMMLETSNYFIQMPD
ncbi:MAG: hypothetical protein J6C81_05480 [Muribaculaceae bacterium]|nr:hypothetical protein [Muribaculaceae bacterium]